MIVNLSQRFNINNLPFQNNKVVAKNAYPNLTPLKKDTISFQAAKFARPKDLMDLPHKEILEICKDAIKKKNSLGEGQEAIVYKIDEYPRAYCVRQEKKGSIDFSKLKLDFDLNKFDIANFVVAKLGEGITLLQYISGIPLKIMRNQDTPSGIKVKESMQELIANNFPEESFIRVIEQIEHNRTQNIIFDRKGENLLVDPMIQELTAIDFSPKFKDIEYNPISYIYHALDVDKTIHGPKVLGKLCKAYAERLKTTDLKELNLDVLDKNFYHRGFMDDAFNYYKDRNTLENVRQKLFDELLKAKKTKSSKEFEALVDEFKYYVDNTLIDPIFIKYPEVY